MSRAHSVSYVILFAFSIVFSGGNGEVRADVLCPRERISSLDPIENRAFDAAWNKAKRYVGTETTDPSEAKIYLTVVNGGIYAHSNFKQMFGLERSKYPMKLWTDKDTFDLETLTFNLLGKQDYSRPNFRDNITFYIDTELLTDQTFGRLNLGVAKRINIIDSSGDVWARDAYRLVSDNPELKRWAKQVRATDADELKRLRELIRDEEFSTAAARFNPSSMAKLVSLKETFRDKELLKVAVRHGISTIRGLNTLKVEITRFRRPEVRNASSTEMADLLIRLRSNQPVPVEWTAKGEKAMMLELTALSPAESEMLIGKVLTLVSEANPDGNEPVIIFTKNSKRARLRLSSFLDYHEANFYADKESLQKVERFGPLAREILDTLTVGEVDGPKFRFVVGHFDGDVVERLIAEAKADKFSGTHLGVCICNKNWAKFLELYDAAMEHGALSVTFPMGPVDIPAMTLTAITLHNNPSFLKMNAPQVAMRKAYREAYSLLKKATEAANLGASKSDAEIQEAIRQAFGDRGIPSGALRFFINAHGQLDKKVIDATLKALKNLRMVPLAKGRSRSAGNAIAFIQNVDQDEIG